MPANSYGIIVEGGYDSAVYNAIVSKLASHEVRVLPRLCEGKSNLIRKFPGLLESFKYNDLGQAAVDIAIVIADADGRNPAELEEELRSKIAGRRYPFQVHFYAVQQAMETWLLADPQAISRAAEPRRGKRVARTHDAPQDLLKPKPFLRELLERHGVSYTSALAAEIAGNLDLGVLAFKCPRFRTFAELVDC